MIMTAQDYVEQHRRDSDILNEHKRERERMLYVEQGNMEITAFVSGRRYTEEHARRLIASIAVQNTHMGRTDREQIERYIVRKKHRRVFAKLIRVGTAHQRRVDGLLKSYTQTAVTGVQVNGELRLVNLVRR